MKIPIPGVMGPNDYEGLQERFETRGIRYSGRSSKVTPHTEPKMYRALQQINPHHKSEQRLLKRRIIMAASPKTTLDIIL